MRVLFSLLLLARPRRRGRPAGHPDRRLRGRRLRRLEDHRHRLRQGPGPGHAARTRCRSPASSARGSSTASTAATAATGTLTSPAFKIERKYLNFLIGGGKHPGKTCINLLVDGKVVRTATGPNDKPGGSEQLDWHTWDVAEFAGKKAVDRDRRRARPAAGATSTSITSSRATRRSRPSRSRARVRRSSSALPAPAGEDRRAEAADDVSRSTARRSASSTSSWPTAKPRLLGLRRRVRVPGQEARPSTTTLPADSKALDAIVAGRRRAGRGRRSTARSTARSSTSPVARGWLNDPNGLVYDGRRVSPLLPAQPVRLELGQHALGPRRQPRPGPLEGTAAIGPLPEDATATGRSPAAPSWTRATRPAGARRTKPPLVAGVHEHRPRRVHRLQHRPRPHLDRVRQEPGRQARRPRPEAASGTRPASTG